MSSDQHKLADSNVAYHAVEGVDRRSRNSHRTALLANKLSINAQCVYLNHSVSNNDIILQIYCYFHHHIIGLGKLWHACGIDFYMHHETMWKMH